jgi:hypothetical protein
MLCPQYHETLFSKPVNWYSANASFLNYSVFKVIEGLQLALGDRFR